MTQPALSFFGLQQDGPASWLMPIEAPVLSGTGALFGGAALGAAAAIVEAVTARPIVWAVIQFVTHARPPSVLHVHAEELARGRRASQVAVVARLGQSIVFTAMATSGERGSALAGRQWVTPPQFPPPDDCPPRELLARHRGRFVERTEARIALTDGAHTAIWMRIPELVPGSPTLGVAGDYVPLGLRHALGDGWSTHSLDNTLRVVSPPGGEWVLADVVIEGVAGGFGTGRVHLWDEDGQLLGTAGQSFTCRRRRD